MTSYGETVDDYNIDFRLSNALEKFNLTWLDLTLWDLVTHICNSELDHHYISVMVCHMFGANPLPKLMLIYTVRLKSKYKNAGIQKYRDFHKISSEINAFEVMDKKLWNYNVELRIQHITVRL